MESFEPVPAQKQQNITLIIILAIVFVFILFLFVITFLLCRKWRFKHQQLQIQKYKQSTLIFQENTSKCNSELSRISNELKLSACQSVYFDEFQKQPEEITRGTKQFPLQIKNLNTIKNYLSVSQLNNDKIETEVKKQQTDNNNQNQIQHNDLILFLTNQDLRLEQTRLKQQEPEQIENKLRLNYSIIHNELNDQNDPMALLYTKLGIVK
ncbi:Hypothetical_protein [Hexamita inflata]|uniref:Hypothetical_protein n=1 Tax=Hexamita inflata TaxID=28002 RepID=A0AA86NP63_9EUKA|nr:Hypothetical protein HINF_LOCUS10579 [Hexamita inflata]